MNPERWQRIKEVFVAALDLDPPGRAAFLDEACRDDPDLRHEVQILLDSHEEAGSFMESPALESVARTMARDRAGSMAGHRIGPYELIREIGSGGMGEVCLAERADEEYRKQVAIKIMRRGMDTEAILLRFQQERQILADLDHPHIARLLDGGTTPEGLPYFVMEYIEGRPITEYCDGNRLTIEARLELFIEVCGAVQYAHQHLVVHRDLKPGNILVTADGVPKLLDFGIARLLSPSPYSGTAELTLTGWRPMTPEYASPEQVRDEAVGIPSDIYSLGVLLYRLLAGRSPYRVNPRLPHEIVGTICREEPEKPSTAVARVETAGNSGGTSRITPQSVSTARRSNPERLRRRLRGDLDNIVLMALRKEPERRYPTVEQFSADIRRHLEGLPVTAHRDTFGYRAGKFARRHKAGIAAAVLVVLSLVGGIVTTARQARIAAGERDRARIEAEKAEHINAFLQQMLSSPDPSWYTPGEAKGPGTTVVEVLDEASRRIETDLDGEPEVKAELHMTIGNTYRSLRQLDAAQPHLEAALDLRRALFGKEHPKVAESLYYLAAVSHVQGDYETAQRLYREVLAILRASSDGESVYLPHTLYDLGTTLARSGDPAAAEPLLREALVLFREHYGSQHVAVAMVLSSLGEISDAKGEPETAQALYQEALEMFQRLGRPSWEAARTLLNLGAMHLKNGEYAEAETVLLRCLEASESDIPQVQWIRGRAICDLAHLYEAWGRPESAARYRAMMEQ